MTEKKHIHIILPTTTMTSNDQAYEPLTLAKLDEGLRLLLINGLVYQLDQLIFIRQVGNRRAKFYMKALGLINPFENYSYPTLCDPDSYLGKRAQLWSFAPSYLGSQLQSFNLVPSYLDGEDKRISLIRTIAIQLRQMAIKKYYGAK